MKARTAKIEQPVQKEKPKGRDYRRCANPTCQRVTYGNKAQYSSFLDTKGDGVCPNCNTPGATLIFTAGT